MDNKKIVFLFLVPVLLSFILHVHVFKLDLSGYHVWRQTQTQTVIYNFSFSDNSIFNPQKFDITNGTTALLYEFPLYQWLIAQVNNLFGYSVFHSRLLTFIFFIFLLLGFYKLLRNFVSTEIALITNCLLCFSPMLYYYGVTPLPDTLALCLAVWGLNFFFRNLASNRTSLFVLFCFFIMLSSLIKLPYILFSGVFVFYIYKEIINKRFSSILVKFFIFCLFVIPVFAWYITVIPTWGNNPVTKGVFNNSKTLLYLLDCFQFNVISTVPEVITNYASCVFLVTGIYLFYKQKNKFTETQAYFITLFVLFSCYFLFELNAIEKVHDYYLMPFIPLVFLVVTYGLNFFYKRGNKLFIIIIVFLVPITAWLRMNHRWDTDYKGALKDYLTEQKNINRILPLNSLCIIDHDDSKFVSLYYLKRKGYSLSEKEINPAKLKQLYLKGAEYLITEDLDTSEYLEFNFDEIFRNELKIYKISLKENQSLFKFMLK